MQEVPERGSTLPSPCPHKHHYHGAWGLENLNHFLFSSVWCVGAETSLFPCGSHVLAAAVSVSAAAQDKKREKKKRLSD
jgi:hypothetical protein